MHLKTSTLRSGLLLFAVLSIVIMVPLSSSEATTRTQMKMAELVNNSALIFLGTVVHVDESAGAEDTGPRTLVTFTISESLMGPDTGPSVTFEIPQGTLPDGRFVEMVGAPRYVFGRTYLVFIKEGVWYFHPTTDWHFSSFEIVEIDNRLLCLSHDGRVVNNINPNGFSFGPRIHSASPQAFLRRESNSTLSEQARTSAIQQAQSANDILTELRSMIREQNSSRALRSPDIRFSPAMD